MKGSLLNKYLLLFIFVAHIAKSEAQSLTAVTNIGITPNLNGLYKYLPQHYDQNQEEKFPLLIMLQGLSQSGNGSSDLFNLLEAWGTGPWQIKQGSFPKSFVQNGKTYEFVIIIPQFVNDPVVNLSTSEDLNALLDYCFTNYNVDEKRVYLAGISSGGGLILDYSSKSKENADKIAAGVIMAPACQTSQQAANVIAGSSLPLWISVGAADDYIYPYAQQWMSYFASSTPVFIPFPKYSVFPGGHSDAWIPMYSPSYKEDGLNIFEWMLLYDRTIVVPVTGLRLSATPKNNSVVLDWKTYSENNVKSFEVQKSLNGTSFNSVATVSATNNSNGAQYSFTDPQPVAGENYYRIKSVDVNGNATYSNIVSVKNILVNISVYPNPVTHSLHIKGNFHGKTTVHIFDANGRLIKNETLESNGNVHINVNELSKGIYSGTVLSSGIKSDFTFVKN